jgi:hypothetical protein
MTRSISVNRQLRMQLPVLPRHFMKLALALLPALLVQTAPASENVPHRPFAYWADVPDKGQFVVGIVYAEAEAYHMWAGGKYQNISWPKGGESYGNDNHQGYLALQYGVTERWALDLSVGYVSAGWRYFDNGHIQSADGLMDIGFGARYQLWTETNAPAAWMPTTTFRAGAVMPGSYNKDFPFAPGLRAAAIEPELLLRKHVGWPGFGLYGDGLFRWNRTTGNNQYIIATGVFQEFKGWEVDVGYKHLQTLSGTDIVYPNPDYTPSEEPAQNGVYNIIYPRDPRENYDALEFGFSYTTSKHHWRYGFQLTSVLDGNNTDAKLWVGGSIDIPFGGSGKP